MTEDAVKEKRRYKELSGSTGSAQGLFLFEKSQG